MRRRVRHAKMDLLAKIKIWNTRQAVQVFLRDMPVLPRMQGRHGVKRSEKCFH